MLRLEGVGGDVEKVSKDRLSKLSTTPAGEMLFMLTGPLPQHSLDTKPLIYPSDVD